MKTDQDRAIEADASGPRNDVLARAMYEAYTRSSGGLNYQGKPCPKWDELPAAICKHWHAAADVARARGARNIGPYRDAVAAARAFEFAQAIAEQAAGEAERVADVVASTWALMRCAIVDVLGIGSEEAIERQAMRLAMDPAVTPDAAFRAAVRRAHEVDPSARATSPAPEASDGPLSIGEPAPYYLGGRGYRTLDAVRAATDASAARLGRQCQAIDHEGGVVYVAPEPEPVAAERAVVEAALATIDEHLRGQFMRTTDGQMVRGYLPDGEGGTSKRYLDANDCRALAGAFGVVADALAAARKGGAK